MAKASVIALRARHDDDTIHSDHVCRLATRLFVGSLEAHGVSPIHLRTLQIGALLHNVGLAEDPPNHHTRGRDIVVGEGLRGFSADETRMIACLVGFHRKRVEPEREALWKGLPPDLQDVTLRLAAILRVADGLDYAQDQTTHIARIRGRRRRRVVVSGEHYAARVNIEQAEKKSDLWAGAIGKPPVFILNDGANERWDPPVRSDQTLVASASRVLTTYLAETVAAMPGLETINGIYPRHDVRVGLRRFRSAVRLYRKLSKSEEYEHLIGELRWVGTVIGEARDRDVSIEWLDRALAECPEEVRHRIVGIRADDARERRRKLKDLVSAHRSERFERLLPRADEWAAAAGSALTNSDRGPTLRTEVRRAFRKCSKRVGAFDGTLDENDTATLHRLRRACRCMRYATEAWYGALGPGRKRLRSTLKGAQDALGDVHDADVRLAIWPDTPGDPAVAWLHRRCRAERMQAWGTFQNTWPKLLRCLRKAQLRSVVQGR